MLRDITLGQYYPADSILHRLDPRVKVVGAFLYIISLFLFKSYIGYIPATVFLAVSIYLSRVPFSYMVKGLKAIVILMLITGLCNLFLTAGEPVVSFGRVTITKEGISTAVKMVVRLSYLVLGSSVLTLTTTPGNLTDALEKLCKGLNRIHVPVHEIAMMLSIALSFIPILMEETDKIMKAQMARGADFESGNIFVRIKALVPLLVPLFVSAFKRAGDLALAMEARCYRGGEGRTKMKPLMYHKQDTIAYAVILSYFAVIVIIRIIWG
ncbi:MAG: energy-coupling factor transporter transmembrane protein EcfT [Lachnospiraceae bacterium]|nr:energy-coupling factor transporter transmembrane protein EcfT [Lachnospiraceae bacterium]